MTVTSLTTITVTLKNRTRVDAATAKFCQIGSNHPRQSLLTIEDEWAIARFGPSAQLRNVAIQFVMDFITVDAATKTAAWEKLYRFLLNEQPVVDRSVDVYEQFIANSPNSEAVDWAHSALGRLRARLASGWKPPFTMQVIDVAPKEAKASPVMVEAVVVEVEELVAKVVAPKKAKAPAKAKTKVVAKPVAVKATARRRFVNLAVLQEQRAGA